MKLRIMKSSAIDTIKKSMPSIFYMYYENTDNQWMTDICGEDPFIDFMEVPDFELSQLDLPKGEIDLQNCEILYSKLKMITESQACDERLWAGLCNDCFYSYMRKRWQMNGSKKDVKKDRAVGEILTRFFFNKGRKAGIYRNTLSKCWWVGHNTYDSTTRFQLLEKLGSNNLNTKINEIFHNYNFSSNKTILKGIIDGINYFDEEGIKITVNDHLRPTMQYINAIGGTTILDCWSSKEIKDLFIYQVMNIIQGNNFIEVEQDDDNDIDYDEEQDFVIDNSTIFADENSDNNEREVRIGDKVKVRNLKENVEKKFSIAFSNDGSHTMPNIPKSLIGHFVGDIIEIEDIKYLILDIEKD